MEINKLNRIDIRCLFQIKSLSLTPNYLKMNHHQRVFSPKNGLTQPLAFTCQLFYLSKSPSFHIFHYLRKILSSSLLLFPTSSSKISLCNSPCFNMFPIIKNLLFLKLFHKISDNEEANLHTTFLEA